MENIIKVFETILKLNSPIDYILAGFFACGLIMFTPSYILLAYPSEDLINNCEYMKYTPYVFVLLSSAIITKVVKFIANKCIDFCNKYYNKWKVKKAKIEYLLNLDIMRIIMIMRFYNAENNIYRLSPMDKLTQEFLYKDIIKWVPAVENQYCFGDDNYILEKWVIDAMENNKKVNGYFMDVLKVNRDEESEV